MKTRFVMLIAFLAFAIQANAKPDRPAVDAKKGASDLINKDAQKAIDTGLSYLAKQQRADGSFGTGAYAGNVAVTGLVGLAFLSAERTEANDKLIADAAKYLLSCEDANRPGFLNGQKAALHGPMYSHGFAVQFLGDAHGRLSDKKQQKEVKALLERSVKLIVDSQNKEGGWRYNPQPIDADISVTACQVAALHASRKAGIDVPKATLDNALQYVKNCHDKNSGGFRYQTFGGGPGFARTAAALASLNALGAKDDEAAKKGTGYLKKTDSRTISKRCISFMANTTPPRQCGMTAKRNSGRGIPASAMN
jgi:Prenyltransferase and squalene oxidase repeat